MVLSGSQGIKFRSVLVIGGGGILGMSVCKTLSKAGYVPVAFDQTHQTKDKREKWGPFIRGSVTEKDQLAAAMEDYKPDAIMMCPDYVDMESPVSDPVLSYRNAISGTLTMLDVASRHAIRDLIYVSSASVYGDAGRDPMREDQPAAPLSIGGTCQMIAERMISDFAQAHSMKFAILRSFAIAGCDDDIADDLHDDRGFLSQIMAVANGKKPQLTIHGGNYTTRDGTAIRDYIHASDVAEAMLLALRALETGSMSRIYNIGSGIGTSALELVHMAERVSGRRIPIAYRPKFEDQAAISISDSSLARVMLGWTPKMSAADQIIRTLWYQWYKRYNRDAEAPKSRAAG